MKLDVASKNLFCFLKTDGVISMTTVSQTINAIARKWVIGMTCAASLLISGLADGHISFVEAAQHKVIVLKQHHVSRSGVIVKSRSHFKKSSSMRKTHANRSGVMIGKRNSRNVTGFPTAVSSKTSSKNYQHRRKQIAIRNELVRRDNLERRKERRLAREGNVPTVLVFDETSENIVTVGQQRSVTRCPQNYNCGTRLYDNRSGPRIIQLRDGSGNDSGHSNGPKIIRLN